MAATSFLNYLLIRMKTNFLESLTHLCECLMAYFTWVRQACCTELVALPLLTIVKSVRVFLSMFALKWKGGLIRMKRKYFANFGLFKDDPGLLSRGCYTISSDVNDTVLTEFFNVTDGSPVSTSLSEDDISRLRALCREMGVDESKYVPSSRPPGVSQSEFLKLVARNSRLEAHVEELSARIRKLELALSGSSSSGVLDRVEALEKRQNDVDRVVEKLGVAHKAETTGSSEDLKKEIEELKSREARVESEIARLHDESYVMDFCGTMFSRGWGFPQNDSEAARFFKMSAARWNSSGRVHYGECFYDGKGVARDYSEAARYIKLSADQGNSEGQYMYGQCLWLGQGVEVNIPEAVRYHRLSAEQGHHNGQRVWACRLLHADTIPEDKPMAAHYFKLSADQGNDDAQQSYGWMILTGQGGLPKDYDVAAHYLQLSAEQGNATGQAFYGWCYLHGCGRPQDYVKAAHYFKLSAEGGFWYGQYYYGSCLEEGKGVDKNVTEAIRYYRKAAEQGYQEAKERLAKLIPRKLPVSKTFA